MPTVARHEFADHCAELLRPLGAVRIRRMFGGHGLYVDEVFVAIVVAELLYLKTDDSTQPAFGATGGSPFAFDSRGERAVTSYWTVPAEAMESPALMQPWARLALEAALRARAVKPASARRKAAAAKPAESATARKARAATPPTHPAAKPRR